MVHDARISVVPSTLSTCLLLSPYLFMSNCDRLQLSNSPNRSSWLRWPWIGRLSCGSIGALLLMNSSGIPTHAQALFHSPVPEAALLQAQSMQLASDAVRLAQFGQTDEALSRLKLGTQLYPTSAELHYLTGSLLLEGEDFRGAVESLQRARDLSPDEPDVLLTLGSAYLRQGSYFAAVEVLERGVALQPQDPNGFFQLGNAYLLRGDDQQSEDAFRQAIVLDPEFWPAVNNIGLLEYERGNIEAAIVQWEETIAINGSAAEPKLALATALYIQGKTNEAEELGKEAIQLDPEYGRLETLRTNLWGEKLMQDVQILLQTETVSQAFRQAATAAATELE